MKLALDAKPSQLSKAFKFSAWTEAETTGAGKEEIVINLFFIVYIVSLRACPVKHKMIIFISLRYNDLRKSRPRFCEKKPKAG